MGRVRTLLIAVAGAASLLIGGTSVASADEGSTLFRFHEMVGIHKAQTGLVNHRGIIGGGLPWVISTGTGELDRNGDLHVAVTGLVIPVAPFNGTNPSPQFAAIVSCVTTDHAIVNLMTAPVTATTTGDATIDATVSLPHPCNHPIVFVTSAGGAWFARSVREDEEED
jgi:hypothetical protein